MKDGLIHVCFVLDESGSMSPSVSDVKGGFKTVIEEQKAQAKGGCIISLFKFGSDVKQVYLGKDVNEIDGDNLTYSPGGLTKMNDGIGIAIDSVGEWLTGMNEEDRPEKNLIVIMTDGEENASIRFSLKDIREKIEHQTSKYNWSFVFMGTDVTDTSYANSLTSGLSNCTLAYNDRDNHSENYSVINKAASIWRNSAGQSYAAKAATMDEYLDVASVTITKEYEKKIGVKIK